MKIEGLPLKDRLDYLKVCISVLPQTKERIIMVLHDINQAAFYSDEMIAMKNGKIIANGSPDNVLTEDVIKETYGIHLYVEKVGGRNFIVAV